MAKKTSGIPVDPMAAFGALAKPKASASKSSAPKVIAQVTPEIMTAVDSVITIKQEIKAKEGELAVQEGIVIGHVSPQQDNLARAGDFTKSLLVEGNAGNVLYNTADSFSVTAMNKAEGGEAVQEAVKNLIGDERYVAWFKKKRTIALKENVVLDQEKIGAIVAAMRAAGLELGEYFNVTDVVVHCEDLDRKQYELDDQTLGEFRALVPPRKAALKSVVK